jgi:antitoxin MazE
MLFREITMVTKIQKWGNSQGIRISRDVLQKAHISMGDTVDISVQTGKIIVKPAAPIRGKYKLKNLLSQMPSTYKTLEENWGKAEGGEIW